MNKDTTPQASQWYVVNVHSGFEDKVIQSIWEKAGKESLSECFFDIVAPKKESVEVKRGVKKNVAKSVYPGYILVNMMLRDDTWHLVRSVHHVSGFLGGKEKPTPLSKTDVERALSSVEKMIDASKEAHHFSVGEYVQVTDGPFASFSGLIENVDADKKRVKVSVAIFGRLTPVDLDFSQIEKTEGP